MTSLFVPMHKRLRVYNMHLNTTRESNFITYRSLRNTKYVLRLSPDFENPPNWGISTLALTWTQLSMHHYLLGWLRKRASTFISCIFTTSYNHRHPFSDVQDKVPGHAFTEEFPAEKEKKQIRSHSIHTDNFMHVDTSHPANVHDSPSIPDAQKHLSPRYTHTHTHAALSTNKHARCSTALCGLRVLCGCLPF